PGRQRSRGPGDPPAPSRPGKTNRTAAVGLASAVPSSPAPDAARLTTTESLFANAGNRLLQQNRHEGEVASITHSWPLLRRKRTRRATGRSSQLDPNRTWCALTRSYHRSSDS